MASSTGGDLWRVRFAGTTLLSATEGVYHFTPGAHVREYATEKLPLACGLVIKDLGYGGAVHNLQLEFLTETIVDTQVWSFYQRCQTAHGGVTGALEIPDLPAFPYCVCTALAFGEQVRIAQSGPLNTASTGFTDGYLIAVELEFTQYRR